MLLKKAQPPRNSTRPKAMSTRNMSNELVRSKNAAHEPARSARNKTAAFGDEAPLQAPCDAIEDQCACLLNVLGAIQYMSIGIVTETENPVREFSAAFALLEREIQRVVVSLRGIALCGEMRRIAGSCSDTTRGLLL
jgi:hypothetical protein